MTQTVLILGANGRFGRNAAKAFAAAGWQVRRFKRGGDLDAAADGVDVIVNAWNSPYAEWAKTTPVLTAQVIGAAKAAGATVIVPGNVYVYGHDMPELIGPGVAHRANHPLGQVRREMEDAYRASGVQVIVLRAGDFLDTEASGNWFDLVLAKGIARGRFVYPGRTGIPHAWAYLPDLTRAAVGLAEGREGLPRFSDLAFTGYTLSGEELAALISAVLAQDIKLSPMAWLPIRLARPFWPEAKGILEMRYLWNTPHALDGSALAHYLPKLETTPPEVAVANAVRPLLRNYDINPDEAMA